jgi:hypothetical protein
VITRIARPYIPDNAEFLGDILSQDNKSIHRRAIESRLVFGRDDVLAQNTSESVAQFRRHSLAG